MNFEVVKERVVSILKTFDREKYPETCYQLEYFISDEYWYDICDFWGDIMESDKKYPLESNVAKLIEEILLDEIKENNHNAMCDLGSLYYNGRLNGVKDYEKAVYYYEMSAKYGNRQAQENLGYCYYYGRLGSSDYKKAYHYFIKGALDGHIISLYKIGDMYKNGLYVEKDEKEAFYIFQHCSEMLNDDQEKDFGADIYIRLADCYYNAIGTDKNLILALEFYQKAERFYYPRILEGDYFYEKQYERSIAMQQLVREELKKEIPDYSWTKE